MKSIQFDTSPISSAFAPFTVCNLCSPLHVRKWSDDRLGTVISSTSELLSDNIASGHFPEAMEVIP